MREAIAGFVVVLAFGCGRSHPGAAASLGASPDSGNGAPGASDGAVDDGGDANADSGAPADDAGPAALADAGQDAGSDAGQDAGPLPVPAQIEDLPCPAAPKVLWSRAFTVEVDFRGSVDADGNLYWVEYDPPPTFSDAGVPWLASADSTGTDRYRVRIAAASFDGLGNLAAGKFLVSQHAAITAYDPSAGAPSWTLDLSSRYPGYVSATMVDAGDGRIVFGVSQYNHGSGLYFVDAATGAIIKSLEGSDSTAWHPVASDGAGTVLVTANPTSTCCIEYHQYADYVALDSSGNELWRRRLTDAGGVLAWSAGGPWIALAGYERLTPMGQFTAAPAGWFRAVVGATRSAAMTFGTAQTPDLVNIIQGGLVVAQGGLEGSNGYDGEAVFSWIAGASGDHVALVSQNWHSIPALCHPSAARDAYLSHFDPATSWQCPFNFQGETAIETVVPYRKQLVLGRRTYLSDACGHQVNPVTIEAYDLGDDAPAPH